MYVFVHRFAYTEWSGGEDNASFGDTGGHETVD